MKLSELFASALHKPAIMPGARLVYRDIEMYIVARPSRNRFSLINLMSGNRWTAPCKMDKGRDIHNALETGYTPTEVRRMIGTSNLADWSIAI